MNHFLRTFPVEIKVFVLTGYAWITGICLKARGQYWENSFVEDTLRSTVGHIAAHELGHK